VEDYDWAGVHLTDASKTMPQYIVSVRSDSSRPGSLLAVCRLEGSRAWGLPAPTDAVPRRMMHGGFRFLVTSCAAPIRARVPVLAVTVTPGRRPARSAR
jgi:hypothetical protein